MKSKIIVECNKTDCFANKDKQCICLSNNDFNKECPFYKKDNKK